jgi:hypothetical protein
MPLPLPARGNGGASPGAVRVRAEVTGGTAAIGVTTWDGKNFVDRRFVWPSGSVVEVFLQLPQLSLAGDLVVQTWDLATSATVRVESATLIVREAGRH